MTELKKSIAAEFFKLRHLDFFRNFLIRVAAITVVFNVGALIIHDPYRTPEQVGQQAAYIEYFNSLFWFLSYVFLPYLMLSVAALTGKEYDWGTMYHLALKGQRPLHFTLSRVFVISVFAVAAYIAIAGILVIVYLVYSSGNYVVIPYAGLGSYPFQIVLVTAFGLFFGLWSQGSTRGIIYVILYVFIVEMAFFRLIGYIAGYIKVYVLRDIAQLSPYAVIGGFRGADAFTIPYNGAMLGTVIYTAVALVLSWYVFRGRELIRARS